MELGERDNMKKRSQLFLALCAFVLVGSAQAETHRLKFRQYEGNEPAQFKFIIFDLDGAPGKKTIELKLGDTFAGLRVEAFRKIERYRRPDPRVDGMNPVNEHEIILLNQETRKETALVYNVVTTLDFPDQISEPTR